MSKQSISGKCPGKINLYLDVTARRENGYHELQTLFLPIDSPSDSITVIKGQEFISIDCDHSFVPTDSRNLCYKAAELFYQKTNIADACKIVLEKRLPVAGGMGGGSSNAAKTLALLNELYEEPLSLIALSELALAIGADVPFFLNAKPSFAEGVGEELQELKGIPQLCLLLITFSFPVSAAWAYKNRLLAPGNGPFLADQLIDSLQKEDLATAGNCIYNDLALSIRQKFPILQKAQNDLLATGALGAEVSGSGPTLFGLYENKEKAESALAELINLGYEPPALHLCLTRNSQ